MTDTVALLGYVPDLYLLRRRMLASIEVLWHWYVATIVLMWVVLPWRLGWMGVGVASWCTFWCAWSRFWLWWSQWTISLRRPAAG